jgi:hypothetical protein
MNSKYGLQNIILFIECSGTVMLTELIGINTHTYAQVSTTIGETTPMVYPG